MTEYDASTYMTDKSEKGQFELLDEVEKPFQELEEEDAKSDSPSAVSAADSCQGQGQVEQVNSADSQQEISACFEAAIKKLDKVEFDADKKKSEIVRKLVRDLDGKMPTDEIAAEIVHQLRGRISGRRIYEYLESEQYAKYKKKHRVENARKRHGRKDQRESAAEPQLKKEVAVLASGQETILKPSHSPEENFTKTQEVGSGDGTRIDTDTSPPQPEQSSNTNTSEPGSMTASPTSPQSIDVHMEGGDSIFTGPRDKSPVCKNCSIKDNRIKNLEDENREMSVRCDLAESSNSKLVLQVTAQDDYIYKLREEEHDLSHLPDEIASSESKSIIPKEKYDMVRDAMDKSKDAIFVKFYGKKFVRAVADVDN